MGRPAEEPSLDNGLAQQTRCIAPFPVNIDVAHSEDLSVF